MNCIISSSAALGFVSAQGNDNMIITLIVFVSLTALLAAFIIALFASKRFRNFFFKEKSDKKEKHEPPKPASSVSTSKHSTEAKPATTKQSNADHTHSAKKPVTKSTKPSATHTRKNGR